MTNVVYVSVKPDLREDYVHLSKAVLLVGKDDSALVVKVIPPCNKYPTGIGLINGTGVLHLEVALERLKGKTNVRFITSECKILYLKDSDSGIISEPIMDVSITYIPIDCLISVFVDLNDREAIIHTCSGSEIEFHISMSNLLNYLQDFRTLTNGVGKMFLRYSHYSEM